MRRRVPIRINQNDRAEYKRLVRNTKAKIARTRKKYGIDISDDVMIPSLNAFVTREGFNKWKDEIKRFTNRANTKYQFVKNEYGVVASKAQIREIQEHTKEAQRLAEKRKEYLENLPSFDRGKTTETVGQQMKKMAHPPIIGIHAPKDFNFNDITSQQQLKEKEQRLEQKINPKYYNEQTEKMRENYIELIIQGNNIPDDLIRKMRNMPVDDWYDMYLQNMSDIGFRYRYTTKELEEFKETLESIVDSYYSGEMNLDLKDF